jgi:hypothetical protein
MGVQVEREMYLEIFEVLPQIPRTLEGIDVSSVPVNNTSSRLPSHLPRWALMILRGFMIVKSMPLLCLLILQRRGRGAVLAVQKRALTTKVLYLGTLAMRVEVIMYR